MGIENIHQIPERIAVLKRKLAAREGAKGFEENVRQIKAEIARLEGLTKEPGALASQDNPAD